MAYDENGNYVPDGDAFNLRTFNTNQNSGYAGQSMSPDYMSSFGKYTPDTNYGMSQIPLSSDISSIGVGTSTGGNWWDSFSKLFGGTNTDGTKMANVGGNIIGGISSLANLGLAWGSYKDTKKNNAFNRDMATQELNMNKQAYNTKMEARKRASQAANPSGDYSFYKPMV